MRIVTLRDAPVQAWRNGGGRTRELLAWPPGDWRVRVSVADIERDGPFSAFAGVQRWFAVLDGHGVRLHLDGRWVEQHAGDAPLAFDGAAAPDCALIDGPTRDLNLMLRGIAGRLDAAPAVPGLRAAGCYVRRPGHVGTTAVAAGTLAWFDGPAQPYAPLPGGPAAPGAWWIHLEDPIR